jgi:hypothetical protein
MHMRSTKDSWLNGPGDLKEADVDDVPTPGESVRVRGLPAKYSAEVQSQLKLTQQGRDQVAKIDVAAMEMLQFVHGVIDPTFTVDEARVIQERFGAAFRKVVAKIDELSGIDKDAIEQVEQRFPDHGAMEAGALVDPGAPTGDSRSDLPVRVGA